MWEAAIVFSSCVCLIIVLNWVLTNKYGGPRF